MSTPYSLELYEGWVYKLYNFTSCTGKNEQNNHLYANTDTIKIPDKYAHHKYAYPTGATHTHEYADMRL